MYHCPNTECREFQSFVNPSLRFLPTGEIDPDSCGDLQCANCRRAAVAGPLPGKPGYLCGGYEKGRYTVRDNPSPSPKPGVWFPLRIDKDPHARVALQAYAASVESVNPILAADLRRLIKDHSQ